MKRIVSETQRTIELIRQRRSPWALLRLVGFSSLLICSLFLFNEDPEFGQTLTREGARHDHHSQWQR